jgi:putative iron-dependent peroxidase
MPEAQKGILAESNLYSLYLMFNALDDVESQIRAKLAELIGVFGRYDSQYSEAMTTGMVAVGVNYWENLYPQGRPFLLQPFPVFQQEDRAAPVIPYDLFIQIRADRFDVCHMIGREVCDLLEGLVELVEQVKGFRFKDGRDLTGFVDGTENPTGLARREVALVGDADPDYAAGSYVHIQRYRHDLRRWNQLPLQDQEDIVGRTKQDDEEYTAENKCPFAHIKRTNLKDANGKSREILRQSMPYGTMKIEGLFFVSCCATPDTFNDMLKNMIYRDEEGNYDKLLDYTQAETGAAFFAPSVNFLMENAGS